MSRTLVGIIRARRRYRSRCALERPWCRPRQERRPLRPPSLSASDAIIPTLSWNHVQGATQYVVELSRSQDDRQRFLTAATVNRNYVPAQPLPWAAGATTTTLYWRVAARTRSKVTSHRGHRSPVRTAMTPRSSPRRRPEDVHATGRPGDPDVVARRRCAGLPGRDQPGQQLHGPQPEDCRDDHGDDLRRREPPGGHHLLVQGAGPDLDPRRRAQPSPTTQQRAATA